MNERYMNKNSENARKNESPERVRRNENPERVSRSENPRSGQRSENPERVQRNESSERVRRSENPRSGQRSEYPENAQKLRRKKKRRRRRKKGRRFVLILILLIIVAGLAYLNVSGHMNFRFRIVSDKDAFQETIIEQTDTGFESVWIATKGFELTGDDVKSIIRTTTENDPEDLCIIPDNYEASYYSAVHLWKITMKYSYSSIPSELSGSTGSSSQAGSSSQSGGASLTEDAVLTAQKMTSTALDEAVAEIKQRVGNSDRSKYKAIFEWVCKNVAYDEDLEYVVRMSNKEDPTILNRGLYGAMCKSTVCSGYAEAFKALCDRLGLECLVVEDAEGLYAWNAVICDGNVFYVDPLGGASSVDTAIDYFMRAPEDFSAEFGHEVDPTYYIPTKFEVN